MDSLRSVQDEVSAPGVHEPQLKYEALQGDVPSLLGVEPLTCLCLSDKILAIGTEAGVVHVLDYSGNQVRALQHHKQPVSDLSFDGAGEYVASCSTDRSVVVSSLYSDTMLRHEYQQPVQSLSLDPRYSSRKTREVAVVLANTGSVHLSAQGWLGRGDTTLFKGPGTQLVRWWGQLIAWITGNALMVYSTVQHLLVRKLERPGRGPAAAYNHASLLWGQNGYLYASWPDCILVARTYTVENSVGTATQHLEVITQLPQQQLVLGVSPFGHDLAVLTFQAGWAPEAATPTSPTKGGALPPPPSEQQAPASAPDNVVNASAQPAQVAGPRSKGDGQEQDESRGQQDHAAAGPASGAPPDAPGSAPGEDTGHQPQEPDQGVGGPRAGAGQSAEQHQDAHLQLRIMGLQGGALACDTLEIDSLLHLLPGGRSPYTLVPSLPATTSVATDKKRLRKHGLPAPSPSFRSRSAAHAGEALTPRAGSHASSQQAAGAGQDTTKDTQQKQALGEVGQPPPTTPALSRASSSQLSEADLGSSHGSKAGPALGAGPQGQRTPQGGARARRPSGAPSVREHEPVYDEDAEFMYFVTTPQAVLIGRMRDLSDHVEWLCGQGRWEDALCITEQRPRLLRPDIPDKVIQGYIGALLSRGAWEEAAVLSPRLMQGSAVLWERWAYMFAQARKLPLLAHVLPTENPRLSTAVYDMVLTSLLATPQDHATAYELAKRWPQGCFNAPNLVQAVVQRVNRGGQGSDMQQNEQLWRLLAHLYETQGRPDLALSILLELKDSQAFTFIAGRHEGLLAGLTPKRLAALVALDTPRATRVLVRHADVVPPTRVVPALQEAMSLVEGPDDDAAAMAARDKWRRALWGYLCALHDADPLAAAPYSELQVSLTADYAPGKLLELLSSSSSSVPLESALAICEEKGLVAEQVFILGRMGNALRALHLIIEQLADIPQAIQFVEGQGDEELWEQLINWALSSPDTTGSLLDHIGGHLNPLALIRRIPHGLTIPHLRDRIRSIIADFRTQTSLREGCNVILRADCARLATRLYRLAAAAVSCVYVAPPTRSPTATSAGWAKYEVGQTALQALPDAREVPPSVAMAAAAWAELQEVAHGPTRTPAAAAAAGTCGPAGPAQASTGASQGRVAARDGYNTTTSGVWVGCLPTLSSEDMAAADVLMATDQSGGPSGRGARASSHPYAVRKRLHASGGLTSEARRAMAEGGQQGRQALSSLVV